MEEVSEDDDEGDDESEAATAVSALTVGDLIEAMKTKAKTATSQPSSVVKQFNFYEFHYKQQRCKWRGGGVYNHVNPLMLHLDVPYLPIACMSLYPYQFSLSLY